MGNNFGACKAGLQSFKLENVENGYWIVVRAEDRLSADREEPLPSSSDSSLGFILNNSLMIMQVHDPDLLDAGLTPGSWIMHVGDTPEELHSQVSQNRKLATIEEFRRRIKDKRSFGLIVRPPEKTDSHLIIRGESSCDLAFTVHPATLRVLSCNQALSNKRVTHVNGIVVETFDEYQKAIIQGSNSYWLTVTKMHSLSLQEIIAEIERYANHAPLYRSTLDEFEGELRHLTNLTSDLIASVKTKLTNQETLVNALPMPPVPSAIDREADPDLYALKQIELSAKELKGFHKLPSLTFRHVDRVAELEVITEKNCEVIEQVLKELDSRINQAEDRNEMENAQEKSDQIATLYQEVINTYRKIKEKLPPPDDAGRERQRVLNTKGVKRANLRDEVAIDKSPAEWPPPNTTKELRDFLRDYEEY